MLPCFVLDRSHRLNHVPVAQCKNGIVPLLCLVSMAELT